MNYNPAPRTNADRMAVLSSAVTVDRLGLRFLSELVTGGELPFQQRVILRDLVDRGACSRERLAELLWWTAEDYAPPLNSDRIIDAQIARLRRKLRPGYCIVRTRHHRAGFWQLVWAPPEQLAMGQAA